MNPTPKRADENSQKESTFSGADHLNDATIRSIAAKRGAICLHFVTPAKARHGTPKATIVDFVDHVDYIRKLVGIDSVALGPDYFPAKGWHGSKAPGGSVCLPMLRERWCGGVSPIMRSVRCWAEI